MKPVRIGDLRRRLVLERPDDAPDGQGGVSRGWMLVDYVWASVEPLRGARVFEADRPASVSTHRIALRWRPDLSESMRFRDGPRLFVIHAAIDADPARRIMICQCEETR